MKVGIVTQPLYANYGGILQNYALQKVLKKMGHTPITLDYMPSLSFGRYLLYVGKSIVFFLSPSKRHPIKPYKHFLERPAYIDAFVRNNIDTTETIPKYSKRILRKYGIEAIIVGSDQVWRSAYNTNVINDMFLAFAKGYPCRKIAYAASFGMEEWEYSTEMTEKLRELAKHFNTASVREDSGVNLCRENLGVEVQTVLDPTLLLDASDYEEFCAEPDPEEKPYLAAYVLDMNDEKTAFIRATAESHNLIIRQMTVSGNGVSIENWLTTIRNATFVITDSYHGSLFSILFGRQFLTFINKKRGADRFVTVFDSLGLNDRLLHDFSSPKELTSIDFIIVNERLTCLRQSSIDYLISSLKPLLVS